MHVKQSKLYLSQNNAKNVVLLTPRFVKSIRSYNTSNNQFTKRSFVFISIHSHFHQLELQPQTEPLNVTNQYMSSIGVNGLKLYILGSFMLQVFSHTRYKTVLISEKAGLKTAMFNKLSQWLLCSKKRNKIEFLVFIRKQKFTQQKHFLYQV